MVSLRFFARRLCDSLGVAAAILFTMELASELNFRKREEGGERLRANEYDGAR